ncbi:MAG: LuxR C-terminal-related transcriptional regulator, partial [Acidimicrobiales bacterium]
TMVWASRLAMRQGDYPSARRWLDLCDPYLPGLMPWWRGLVATHHGWAAMYDGDLAVAAERCEHAIELAEEAGDTVGAARALGLLSFTQFLAGDLAEAKRMGREADAMAEAVGNMTVAAHIRPGFCYCAFVEGDVAEQRRSTLATLAAIDAGGFLEEIDILGTWALLAVAEGRFETAGRLDGAWPARGARRGNQPGRAAVDLIRPFVERMLGPVDPAEVERLAAEGARMSMDELRAEALEEPEREPVLTRREREVATHVAEGLNNRQIAERLYISRRTVETHVENIRRKLGLASRYEIRRPNP